MDPCRVRRGFFVLRDCGESSSSICAGCQRPVCQAHVDAASSWCVECAARDKDGSWDDPSYPYQMRSRTYRTGYMPIYWGSYDRDPYYSDLAVRDFDGDDGDDGAFDGDEAGDFHDS